MGKIVDLKKYKSKAIEQRAFGPWQKRFGKSFGEKTKLSDISNNILFYLAQPGEESTTAYYEFIMGVLDLGAAPKFYYLQNDEQMRVVDVHLFLADQVRFEMMRRLGWLKNFLTQDYRLIEIVQLFDQLKFKCRANPPRLDSTHPEFDAYQQLTGRDKEVFIRRMLREALEMFKKGLDT